MDRKNEIEPRMNAGPRGSKKGYTCPHATICVHPRPSAVRFFPSAISATCALKIGWFPGPDKMKQNDAHFCRPANEAGPGSQEPLAEDRRQNDRILSPRMGPPTAPTTCKRRPQNDLRSAPKTSQRQNSIIPERQGILLRILGRYPTKCSGRPGVFRLVEPAHAQIRLDSAISLVMLKGWSIRAISRNTAAQFLRQSLGTIPYAIRSNTK
jgi:hypothetical protein